MIYGRSAKGGEDHRQTLDLPAILPRNFMMSLWHWLLTSGLKHVDISHLTRSSWVHVTRNPTAFRRKQVSRMRHKMSHQKQDPGLWWKLKGLARLWWVFQQKPISLLLQLTWWWHQTSGTNWDWARLNKANCIYLLLFLKLFTSASYKTWNVKRPRVNNVLLKCNRTCVFFSSVFFAQTVVASTASAACCMAVNHPHVFSI